jgi:DNA gyrase subunit A
MSDKTHKIPVNIEDEMRSSYVDYAMSVIIGRALPDVRDGLKPVHRRVLYAMHDLRNTWNTAYKKSARIVGDVIGKYHPHGDSAVYDTIVRMAQDFSMRYPLVDGQGNFGSVDGDPAAAMRYTEIRMKRLAGELLADLEKETVDFQPNYDDSLSEPIVLPTKFPNLLVNGSAGIAVGMATNIPPHNLREVIDATVALIRTPDLDDRELLRYIPGPDFPTAGYIYGRSGIRQAYATGRGIIKLRAKAFIETQEKNDRQSIVVTEIPYQVNKAKLLERIAELVREKRIEGISDLRDESDRDGMRMVIELKRDAVAQVVLNQLFQMTPMQSSFGIINLAIVGGQPRVLGLKPLLQHFVTHRRDVVTRRTIHELRKAEEREHILLGFKIALDHIDEIIELIKTSANPPEARERLMARFGLSEIQAQEILNLRLQRLTGLERDKILQELAEIQAEISRLKAILADENLLMDVIVQELEAVREQYGDERRTEIVDEEGEIDVEDLIADEEMVVTVSHSGYIKRAPIAQYRSQHRGGRGRTGMNTREEDLVSDLFVASTHTRLFVFTDRGRVFQLKVYEVPKAGPAARGRPIVNLIQTEPDEMIRAILPIRELDDEHYVMMVTRRGVVKKTALSLYANIRASGIRAILIDEGDDLIAARLVAAGQEVMLSAASGQSIRFNADQVRPMGRATRGVRGMSLGEGDRVVAMEPLAEDEDVRVLSVTANGYGKRSRLEDYRLQKRGGLGIITIKTTERNGAVVAVRLVGEDDHVILITDGGKIIRLRVRDIRVIGRNTQGVRLINLETGEHVVGIERIEDPDEEDEQAVAAVVEASGEAEEGDEDAGELDDADASPVDDDVDATPDELGDGVDPEGEE